MPPPGNLGRTYAKPTRLVPEDKHPRQGMLEVTVPESFQPRQISENERIQAILSIRGIDEKESYYGEDGRWHFVSEPLIPGVPHIFHLKAELVRIETVTRERHGQTFQTEVETKLKDLGVRTVRLIPGRVVELAF